ncbi:unnamed protein product, partial [Brachionus calyciflorus]
VRHGFCKEFLICPLLTRISHLMRKFFVSALASLEPLIANTSRGKSTAMSLIKKSLYEIENYNRISRTKSNLINAGTVETLLSHLEENPCLVSFYDESSTFMSSFGIYKCGDGKYDRNFLANNPLTRNKISIDRTNDPSPKRLKANHDSIVDQKSENDFEIPQFEFNLATRYIFYTIK